MFHVVYAMSYIIHGFIYIFLLYFFLCGIVIKCEKFFNDNFVKNCVWFLYKCIIAYSIYIHPKLRTLLAGKKQQIDL